MTFKISEVTTYQRFVQKWDPELLQLIAPLDPNLMNEQLYIIECYMTPDDKHWT